MNWRDVPIPKRMRALAKDRRGYPIPFNVLRDNDGRPHFTVNDSNRQRRSLLERRCAICGNRLANPMWFVGGPLSAFHEEGAYMDTALHHDCMTYALQVCPYLAAPAYLGRIDDATVDYSKLPGHVILEDYTQIPDRPALFVAVASHSCAVIEREQIVAVVKPHRPYVAIEYWQRGARLPDERGQMLSAVALSEAQCHA